MEVTSGDYVLDRDNVKETDLTEEDDECSSVNRFDLDTCKGNISDKVLEPSIKDICDEFSQLLSEKRVHILKNRKLKETDLTDDILNSSVGDIKETNLSECDFDIKETDLTGSDDEDIKETDLTGTDDELFHDKMLSVSNHIQTFEFVRSLSPSTKISQYNKPKDRTNSYGSIDSRHSSVSEKSELSSISTKHLAGNLIIDNRDNDCESEAMTEDMESGFFEGSQEKLMPSFDPTSVTFQDLESDFFETDCETTEKNETLPKETGYFQDVESDFFDDDDEISLKKMPFELSSIVKSDQIKSDSKKTRKNKLPLYEKNKAESMSNNLLRSTISELERALNDSNLLLAKRDQKIQELRSSNSELKKNLNKELENNSQAKLLLLEKEAMIFEKEITMNELQVEISKINKELVDLRLYKLNNIRDSDTNVNIDHSSTGINSSDEVSNIYARKKKSGSRHKKQGEDASNGSYNHSPHSQSNIITEKQSDMKPKCKYWTQNNMSSSKSNPLKAEEKPVNREEKKQSNSCDRNPGDEKASKTELHAQLRMKFMRDAFFYYMIGFHPDEQINAILAILDYGDKRQDFVLEAHKMKKIGKKFSASKVSTRALTFVQQELK